MFGSRLLPGEGNREHDCQEYEIDHRQRGHGDRAGAGSLADHYRASAILGESVPGTGVAFVPTATTRLVLAPASFRFHSRLNDTSPLTCRMPEADVMFVFSSAIRCFPTWKRPDQEVKAIG